MGNDVEIKVSSDVAEWLRLLVVAASPSGERLFEGLDSINRMVVLDAIDFGIMASRQRPRFCEHCGKSLYVTGYGRPRKYCDDACRKAASRKRLGSS